MFAIQNGIRTVPRLMKISQNQCRTILGTPPRVRVPFAEKMVLAAVFYSGMMAIPLYVAVNVKNYNAKKKDQ